MHKRQGEWTTSVHPSALGGRQACQGRRNGGPVRSRQGACLALQAALLVSFVIALMVP